MKSRSFSSILVTTALLLTQAPVALAATTWYVNGVGGSDSHNCKSPLTACRTIGHAISFAASGDSVRVAAATYTEYLTIGMSLNVIGAGASTTVIDGALAGRVLSIPNAGSVVTLSNVTIRRGSPHAGFGGGIDNYGILTINSSVVSGNEDFGKSSAAGGGIHNVGTLTINDSTVSGNGAGCSAPPLHCNLSGFGGGIYNQGTLTINSSTVSGNEIFATTGSALGGGIYNVGKLTINNSTLSGNRAGCSASYCDIGGAIGNDGGTVTISNSTVAGNSAGHGGGIYGVAHFQNSIVANNGPSNCYDGPVSSIFSLSSDNGCNLNGPGDLNNVNPKLGTLGNYGGPTQTIPLLSGSPAIDAGNPSGCTDGLGHLLKTDQRGLPRPDTEDRSGCDMGAFEKQNPAPATHLSVSAPGTVQQGNPFKLIITARDAANNLVAGYAGTVHFSSTDARAGLPGNSTLTNGMGVFSATLGVAGTQTITATDTVTASISGTSSPIDVVTDLCRTRGEHCSPLPGTIPCCPGLRCTDVLPFIQFYACEFHF
jgi:hypothetical protein